MIGFEGILDGGTAALIVFSSIGFGLFSLYKSIKLKASLLTIAGFAMVFVGFLWLGPTVDFIFLLLGLGNIVPYEMYAILSYLWVAPALLFAIYLGSELLVPKKKWILVAIYVVLGIAFEYFLWFDTAASFRTLAPTIPGETIIDASFNTRHPTFLLIGVFLISALIFLGIGFAIKAKQSTGLLRKKFIYLSVGFIIFVLSGALDSIIKLPLAIGVIRVVMATFSIWMYLGLKT